MTILSPATIIVLFGLLAATYTIHRCMSVPGDASDVQAFLADSASAMLKGYNEYNKFGKHFLLRMPQQVLMVVAPRHIDEIQKAKMNELSHKAAGNTILQTKYTLHPKLEFDQYHIDVVQRQITQSLGNQLMDLVEEAQMTFQNVIGNPTDWKDVHMYSTAFSIATRVSNRILSGPVLCRNPDFLKYSADYTRTTFGGAAIIRNYPAFIRNLMMLLKTNIKSQQNTSRRFLLPVIKERLVQMNLYASQGRMQEFEKVKPRDGIQWVLDMTPPQKHDPEILVRRVCHVNVTAVHAPCVSYLEFVYELCRHPEVHNELRAEMYEVFRVGDSDGLQGWTRERLGKLWKLDSFMRESMRTTPLSAIKLERLAMKDYVLSDGTVIPAGTSIGVNAYGISIDGDFVENPEQFDPWRWSKKREEPGMENQYSFVQTSPTNLIFGHGKHACPGKHYATALIKILLCYTLMKYDVKFTEGMPEAKGFWTQKFRNADPNAHVSFKLYEGGYDFSGMI